MDSFVTAPPSDGLVTTARTLRAKTPRRSALTSVWQRSYGHSLQTSAEEEQDAGALARETDRQTRYVS